jgi:hypothetical protein
LFQGLLASTLEHLYFPYDVESNRKDFTKTSQWREGVYFFDLRLFGEPKPCNPAQSTKLLLRLGELFCAYHAQRFLDGQQFRGYESEMHAIPTASQQAIIFGRVTVRRPSPITG